MDIKSHTFDRLRKVFSGSLVVVEYAGLLVIRHGHARHPYRKDADKDPGKACVRE